MSPIDNPRESNIHSFNSFVVADFHALLANSLIHVHFFLVYTLLNREFKFKFNTLERNSNRIECSLCTILTKIAQVYQFEKRH